MDPLGQTPPKELLSNTDGQNSTNPPATTPVSAWSTVEVEFFGEGDAPLIMWLLVRKSEELNGRLDVKETIFFCILSLSLSSHS